MVDHRWLIRSARSATTVSRTVREELFGLPDPVDPDHVAASALLGRRRPGQGVFEHSGAAA